MNYLNDAGCPVYTFPESADEGCDQTIRVGKTLILTHDFLFEDADRGMGATKNLPKLAEFIALIEEQGYTLNTMDNYLIIEEDDCDTSTKNNDSGEERTAFSLSNPIFLLSRPFGFFDPWN